MKMLTQGLNDMRIWDASRWYTLQPVSCNSDSQANVYLYFLSKIENIEQQISKVKIIHRLENQVILFWHDHIDSWKAKHC